MENTFREVDGWLKGRNVVCKREWLEACITWIIQEEGPSVAMTTLQDLVYQQWSHADLRETSTGCLPPAVFQAQTGLINGSYVMQIDSVINVGAPAYAQLQKLKGRELDEAELTKNPYETKPTRMLLLSLTDGCGQVQGMEYQPIHQLTTDTLPGTKLLLQGEIAYRLGVLLLTGSHVISLGGGVEELITQNNEKTVLAKLLYDETVISPVLPVNGYHPQPDVLNSHQQQSINSQEERMYPHQQTTGDEQDTTREKLYPRQNTTREVLYPRQDTTRESLYPRQNTTREVLYPRQDTTRENLYPHQDTTRDVLHPHQDTTRDVLHPHQDTTRESLYTHEDATRNVLYPRQDTIGEGLYTSFHDDPEDTGWNFEEDININQFCDFEEDNSILSNTRTGLQSTSENEILVLPVCQVLQHRTNTRLYVKAIVTKLEGNLNQSITEWCLGASIEDGTGEIPVIISNNVIQELIGFSCQEFHSTNQPTPDMIQGLKRCQHTLASIHCVMELQLCDNSVIVTRLLDV